MDADIVCTYVLSKRRFVLNKEKILETSREKNQNGYIILNLVILSLGYLGLMLFFLLPPNTFSNFLGELKIGGFVTIIFCPMIGIIGLIVSGLTYKIHKFVRISFIVSYILFIFAFFIIWTIISILS